jgi:hypothetical protein
MKEHNGKWGYQLILDCFFDAGVVEIPAIAISILFLLKMGRRWPLCLTMMGSGVACLLTLTITPGMTSRMPEFDRCDVY